MAESSTNGKGKDEGEDAAPPATTTHESGPGDHGTSDDDVDLLARGTTVGRYLVLERLGAGAMGVAYAAYDPKLDRKIALKLLRPQEGRGDQARRTARLEREAQAIAKLSHPNVVGIFDVGVHQGQVFLAMEYLGGGTLRDWLAATKRPWREIVKMFIEVGHGLAAAHAEGLIHRDFKPDNVLLDKAGTPKVVDFGLVRLTSGIDLSIGGSIDPNATEEDDAPFLPLAATVAAALTRTGALAGTPAYMAPEQFLGKPVNARTDQFAFCVALHEALYGERPFAGENIVTLADAVTSGRLRPPPKESDVPAWIRQIVRRGLETDPKVRLASLDALVQQLRIDPRARARTRLVATGLAVTALSLGLYARNAVVARRTQIERQVAAHLNDADARVSRARGLVHQYVSSSHRAFDAFDHRSFTEGERLWAVARAEATDATETYGAAIASVEAALTLSQRDDVRGRLLSLLQERLLAAEQTGPRALIVDATHALHAVAAGPDRADIGSPRASLTATVLPSDAKISLERYASSADGNRAASLVGPFDSRTGPVQLDAGSYRLTIETANIQIRYPILLKRNDRMRLQIAIKNTQLPPGFALVPAGRFLLGDEDEDLRQTFLKTVPIHDAATESFIIGVTEVTYAQWIDFLDSTQARGQRRLWPDVAEQRGSSLGGSVHLTRRDDNRWALFLDPAGHEYRAIQHEPIRYLGRRERSVQDWLSMPVTGISEKDMDAYLGWLDRTDRVHRARLCSEREWERAARGADDRLYPHGDTLAPEDANHDATYGRIAEAFGPDAVCSFPRSLSPFGICDMAGNVLELTTSSFQENDVILRGGGYYFFRNSERLTNREPFLASARSAHVGFRVCANADQWVEALWSVQPDEGQADIANKMGKI
jgi:formylglycine-generating enzyme required for sulfatase activity